jgi:hypothetical protein
MTLGKAIHIISYHIFSNNCLLESESFVAALLELLFRAMLSMNNFDRH